MVVLRLGLLVCCLLLPLAGATAELALEWRTPAAEWGKPLRGFVRLRGITNPGAPAWAAWEQAFHVDLGYRERSTDTDGAVTYRQAFSLYPRATGSLVVPPLSWAGLSTQALPIEVAAPRPEGATVRLESSATADVRPLRVGEAHILWLKLTTSDRRARVEMATPVVDGLTFRPLESIHAPSKSEPGMFEHRLGWSLVARAPGSYRLTLPPLRYLLFGQTLGQFHLPARALHVQALPAYIPPHRPVGRPQLTSRLAGDTWRIDVVASGPLPDGLPELRAALAHRSDVELPQVTAEIVSEPAVLAVSTRVTYLAPLPAWQFGAGAPLRLRYFDLDTQRVEVLEHQLPPVWRIPWFAWAIVIVLGLSLLGKGGRSVWRRWRLAKAARLLRRNLLASPSPQALRRRLLQANATMTLTQWRERWDPTHCDTRVQAVVARLNRLCFQRESTGLDWLSERADLVDVLLPLGAWWRSTSAGVVRENL